MMSPWTDSADTDLLWLNQQPHKNFLVPSTPSNEPAETGPMVTKPSAVKERRMRKKKRSQTKKPAARGDGEMCVMNLLITSSLYPLPPMSWQREFWRGSEKMPESRLTCDRWGSVGGGSFWLRLSLFFLSFFWLLSLIHRLNQRRLVATGLERGATNSTAPREAICVNWRHHSRENALGNANDITLFSTFALGRFFTSVAVRQNLHCKQAVHHNWFLEQRRASLDTQRPKICFCFLVCFIENKNIWYHSRVTHQWRFPAVSRAKLAKSQTVITYPEKKKACEGCVSIELNQMRFNCRRSTLLMRMDPHQYP